MQRLALFSLPREVSSSPLEDPKELIRRGLLEEALLLRTCWRREVYALLPEGAPGALPEPDLRGGPVVRHLLRVLLGLESFAVGEFHVVRQVRDAYEGCDTCGATLHRLFQRALGVGGALRTSFHPGREPSIPWLAVQAFRDHPRWPQVRALVLGAGEMGLETARVLGACEIPCLLTNRSPRPLPEDPRIEPLPWEGWPEALGRVEGVFCCTAAPEPLLGPGLLGALKDPPWVLDLGRPPQSAPFGGVRVLLEDLAVRAEPLLRDYRTSLSTLEAEADRAAEALTGELVHRSGDTWKRLALARGRALARDRAKALRGDVPPEELERFAEGFLRAFLHPLLTAPPSHTSRAWRILSGSGEEEP